MALIKSHRTFFGGQVGVNFRETPKLENTLISYGLLFQVELVAWSEQGEDASGVIYWLVGSDGSYGVAKQQRGIKF